MAAGEILCKCYTRQFLTEMQRILPILLLLTSLSAAVAEVPDLPNFIVLFADDQGWGDLGVYGHPDIRTPHIDQMAHEGCASPASMPRPFAARLAPRS